jgi:hypothetical protein
VVCVYFGIQYWQNYNTEKQEEDEKLHHEIKDGEEKDHEEINSLVTYVPSVVSTLVILFANKLYTVIATKMVHAENIRKQIDHEQRLASLLYKFSFVNSYTYFFMIAFWERNVGNLAYQLFTFLCIKQIAYNIIEYFQNRILVGKIKHRFVRGMFNSLLKQSIGEGESCSEKANYLKMQKDVEEQMVCNTPEDSLTFHYMEPIIQFGFILMFSNSFPLAALFSFITNYIEIRNKIDGQTNFNKRDRCQGASGVGNWLNLMELLSQIGIPINCAIMFFCGQNSVKNSKFPAEEDMHSSLREYFKKLDPDRWTLLHIALLVVVIEHILFVIKSILKNWLPDKSDDVLQDEMMRPQM